MDDLRVTKSAERLGRAIAARRGELGLSQRALADRLGEQAGLGTVRRLEQYALHGGRDEPGRPRPTTLASIDRALEWDLGTAARTWDGGTYDDGDRLVIENPDRNTRVLISMIDEHSADEAERRRLVAVAVAAIRAVLGED